MDSLRTLPSPPASERDRERERFGPGLYVHFPFCVRRCGYCDFYVVVGAETARARFVDHLLREADLAAAEGRFAQPPFRSVFLGGGTPSLLTGPEMTRLLDGLRACFSLTDDAEITVECNPESLDAPRLEAYLRAGVNRISLGVQSMDDSELSSLDRMHGTAAVRDRFADVRAAGAPALSADLIYGLPESSVSSWTRTLEMLLELQPDHLSAYLLTLEPHVPLARRLVQEGRSVADDEVAETQYADLRAAAAAVGLEQYEISNFARPGSESRHNLNYWSRGDYLGLGPSAHSHRGGRRWANVRSLRGYGEAIGRGELPREGEEVLSQLETAEEWILLGLRRSEGVDLAVMDDLVEAPARERLESRISHWTQQGRILRDEDRIRLRPDSYFVSNALFADLAASLW